MKPNSSRFRITTSSTYCTSSTKPTTRNEPAEEINDIPTTSLSNPILSDSNIDCKSSDSWENSIHTGVANISNESISPLSYEGASSRYLLILDLNGTLCHRQEPYKRAIPNAPPPAFKHKSRRIYDRPHLESMFYELWDIPNLSVYVATSIAQQNASPILERLIPTFAPSHPIVGYLLHRDISSCPLSKGESGLRKIGHGSKGMISPWDTKRDLKKIWKHVKDKEGVAFDETSTIVVDSDQHKLVDCERNGLLVPSYDPAGAAADRVLLDLVKYIEVLVRSAPKDVRDYLSLHDFTSCKELGVDEADEADGYDTDDPTDTGSTGGGWADDDRSDGAERGADDNHDDDDDFIQRMEKLRV